MSRLLVLTSAKFLFHLDHECKSHSFLGNVKSLSEHRQRYFKLIATKYIENLRSRDSGSMLVRHGCSRENIATEIAYFIN